MTTTETPKTNSLDTNKILHDRKVDESEVKQTSEYINKTKKIEIINSKEFTRSMMDSTKKFINTTTEDIRKTTDPKQLQEKSEAIGHYINVLKNIYDDGNNDKWQELNNLNKRLEYLQKDIAELLKDPDLQEKGHKIIDQLRFQNGNKDIQETYLWKKWKAIEMDKTESQKDYVKRCDNVIQKIFWNEKKFLDIRMNDIYNLSAEQKANLAYNFAVLAPTKTDENRKLLEKNLQEKLSFISRTTPQEIADIKNIFAFRKNEMRAIYASFFKPGEKVLPIKDALKNPTIESPEERKEPEILKTNYKKFAFEIRPTK